ncbi:cysteine desulfurase-like protein [Meiothermus sp. CFH 77666]|uniref:cysteine desulfurase-like protein n=1 Tax=Meiothermus sp. CFH 77666 TaxID=2817942 RepID=UPI001AA08F26|nr:cysteine desulfurase-like protein [Meiothermus sp. CFH 77666]MBO1437641.1 cysteine desulfurase-like protein [Meiothermus sp. CFH 77666]
MSIQVHFPALASGFSFLDNAAGAQVPRQCIEGISRFLSTSSCNVGMPYPGSQAATLVREQTRQQTAAFFNCKPGEVAIGPSATALTFILSRAFSRLFGEGDEVVISELEHEANASPWRNLQEKGVQVRVWKARWDEGGRLEPADLRAVISPRTRLVAVTSAANSLGTTPDVAAAAEIAHSVGAWCITDLVHFSPHHLPDVQASGVDMAFFSAYKVFGPHLAFLYVREELMARLPTDKLWFIPEDSLLKFEPGTNNHEGLAGWLGTLAYLRDELGGGQPGREGLQAAYRRIEALEQPLVEQALERLQQIPGLKLYGMPSPKGRVGTFCFNLEGQPPFRVAEQLAQVGVGVAAGHYYATMPMQALGLWPDGAIRASIAHYTTQTDLDKLIAGLQGSD